MPSLKALNTNKMHRLVTERKKAIFPLTLEQVASRAETSKTTVSLTVNGDPERCRTPAGRRVMLFVARRAGRPLRALWPDLEDAA